MRGRWLIISDVQEPFGVEGAIPFCRAVQKEFRIDDDHIFCAGDESDFYFGSSHPKDPDAWLTPSGELKTLRLKLQLWARVYPRINFAVSNHMLRWLRRAFDSEIPKELLRDYREVIGAPKGWVWRDEWLIKSKHPWRLIHGMGYSGKDGHRNAALDAGISTAIGHLHAHAGICHINTGHKRIWGMNTSCLIDMEAFAFQYSKYDRQKAVLGVGVVIDDGLTPIYLPFERF